MAALVVMMYGSPGGRPSASFAPVRRSQAQNGRCVCLPYMRYRVLSAACLHCAEPVLLLHEMQLGSATQGTTSVRLRQLRQACQRKTQLHASPFLLKEVRGGVADEAIHWPNTQWQACSYQRPGLSDRIRAQPSLKESKRARARAPVRDRAAVRSLFAQGRADRSHQSQQAGQPSREPASTQRERSQPSNQWPKNGSTSRNAQTPGRVRTQIRPTPVIRTGL